MENYTFERFEEELDNGYQMYYTYVRTDIYYLKQLKIATLKN